MRILCAVVVLAALVSALEVPEGDFLLDHPAVSLSVGVNHICALSQRHNDEKIGGEALCASYIDDEWGKLSPPSDSTFVQVISGEEYGCGLKLDQTLQCWGSFAKYKFDGMFSQIVGTAMYGCGVMTDGTIRCFGHLPRFEAPKSKVGFVQVDCANDHCCALDKLGVVTCVSEFPPTDKGQHFLRPPVHKRQLSEEEQTSLEDGYADEDELAGDDVQFKQISVTSEYSCGITFANDIQCWGKARKYGLTEALQVAGPFKQVSAGESGICGIYADEEAHSEGSSEKSNRLECWGNMAKVMLRDSHKSHPNFLSEEFDQVRVRRTTICAVTMDSEVKCIGDLKRHGLPEDLIVA